MKHTDTSEKGLEDLIVAAMTGEGAEPAAAAETHEGALSFGGTGWVLGDGKDYDREYAVGLFQLRAFLAATQPEAAELL